MATQQTNDTGEQRTQLVLDITPALRKRIERAAARGDLSAAEYAERLLEQAVPEEEEEQEQEAVKTKTTHGRPVTQAFADEMRRIREEWQRNHPGVVAGDSVELIRQMREERTEQLERAIKGE